MSKRHLPLLLAAVGLAIMAGKAPVAAAPLPSPGRCPIAAGGASAGGGTTDDTKPPIIVLTIQSPSLWPPDHRMVSIGLKLDVADNVDPDPKVVLTVCSDESDNLPARGDGNTVGDSRIVLTSGIHESSPGKECVTVESTAKTLASSLTDVLVRAERDGRGIGRTYRITVLATDATGNGSKATTTIFVPHDQRD